MSAQTRKSPGEILYGLIQTPLVAGCLLMLVGVFAAQFTAVHAVIAVMDPESPFWETASKMYLGGLLTYWSLGCVMHRDYKDRPRFHVISIALAISAIIYIGSLQS